MASRGRGQVVVFVNGDASGLASELASAEKQLEDFGSKSEKLGNKLSAAGSKMTLFATVPVVAAMGFATNAASNLEQSIGGVESVFGSAAGKIRDFGDDAAQTTGLSSRQVNEMASVIGAGLKGMGFSADEAAEQVITLEKRAADMAATFGGTTEEAIQSVSSALRGERDPIEKYGVSLKQADVDARIMALGLDTTTAAAQKKATAIATLDLIMQATSDTEGQFAREAEGAAGSLARAKAEMENASAELGSHLLPIAAEGATLVSDLAKSFGSLPESVQQGVLALGGVVAISGPMLTLTGNVLKLHAALQKMEWARTAAGLKGLGIAAGVAGGLLAVKVGLDAVGLSADNATVRIERLAAATDDEMVRAFDRLNEFDGSGLATFERLAESNIGAAIRLRDALSEDGRSTRDLDDILDDAAEGQRRMASDTERGSDALKTQAATAEETEDALRGVLDATLATFNAELAYADATNNVEDALADLYEAGLKAAASKGNDATANEELGRAADEAAQAILRQAAAAAETIDPMATAAEKAAIQRQELLNVAATLAPGAPLRVRLEEWAAKLGEIPGSVPTHIDVLGVEQALVRIRTVAAELAALSSWTKGQAFGPAPDVAAWDAAVGAAAWDAAVGRAVTNNFNIFAPDPQAAAREVMWDLRKVW